MLKSPSPRLSHLRSFVLSIGALFALGELLACGGGSSSQTQTQPPPPPPGAQCVIGPAVTTSPSVANGVGVVVPSTFMDLHVGSADLITGGDVSVPYGSIRLWDTSTGWAQINPSQGNFDFSTLDGFVSAAQGAGVDILYNLARTPTWASSNPTDASCSYDTSGQGGPGQCDPPIDLNADGSGADADRIQWVTNVATQYKGQIAYYEIWNEWNIPLFWTGTPAQLVRMEQDARCVVEGPPAGFSCNSNSTFLGGPGVGTAVDKSARIVSPSPVGAAVYLNNVQQELITYFGTTVPGNPTAPGGTFADVIGFHGYVSTKDNSVPCPNAEDVTTVVGDMASVVGPGTPGAGKPWFDTEDSWGKAPDEGFTDPDRQAAFLARDFLLQQSMGVARVYWYRWDATSTYGGALWTSSSGPTEAATAWGQVSSWIVGNEITAPGCTAFNSAGVWTCPISNPSGSWKGLAVWDASQDCDNGTCTYSNFTVPSGGYTQYVDIDGDPATTTSTGATVQIGSKPILLETGNQ